MAGLEDDPDNKNKTITISTDNLGSGKLKNTLAKRQQSEDQEVVNDFNDSDEVERVIQMD